MVFINLIEYGSLLLRTYTLNCRKRKTFLCDQKKPGSRGTLLPPSPLRTVRDRLPSYGSSPSKANLGIEVTQRLKISITSAIHTDSQNPFRGRAHGSHNVASFAFPPKIGSTSFLATKHPMDVCTLTGRIMLSLKLSTRIHPITGWPSLRPSPHPIPPTACLTVSLPHGAKA